MSKKETRDWTTQAIHEGLMSLAEDMEREAKESENQKKKLKIQEEKRSKAIQDIQENTSVLGFLIDDLRQYTKCRIIFGEESAHERVIVKMRTSSEGPIKGSIYFSDHLDPIMNYDGSITANEGDRIMDVIHLRAIIALAGESISILITKGRKGILYLHPDIHEKKIYLFTESIDEVKKYLAEWLKGLAYRKPEYFR